MGTETHPACVRGNSWAAVGESIRLCFADWAKEVESEKGSKEQEERHFGGI